MGVLGPTRKDGLPPYYDTKVPPERTQAEIIKLLYQYGASGTSWGEIREPGLPPYQLEFLFPITAEDGRVLKLAFRMRPPMLYYHKPGNKEKPDFTRPHPAMTLRLLYHYLKAKLEATAYGLTSMVQEFLPEVVAYITGPDGEPVEATMGEVFLPKIMTGTFIEPGGLAKKLPPPPKEEE